MKQLTQNLKTGTTEIIDAPVSSAKIGQLLISSCTSIISAGTEKMLVEFGRSGLLAKARQQPEKVQQVLEKIKTDGLVSTFNAVHAKLDQAIPLGYCNAGVVVEVGSGLEGFKLGDRVASNGHHAEMVVVPKNLCARIPEQVSDEEAAFTVLGAIALQGVRLAEPTIGESFAVIGLGLIGQLTVQILQANGCRVLGIDRDERRLALAESFGAETVNLNNGDDPVKRGIAFTGGRGIDGVLITASTDSNDPVCQGARMSRKRGRLVLVGVSGLQLNRADFYEKELSFQVSCSYGPGRYVPEYEEKGHDYPPGFVRWTEQRNFEAVLALMADGKIDVKPLISHRYPFDRALEAYDLLAGRQEPYLGIVLQYTGANEESKPAQQVVQLKPAWQKTTGKENIDTTKSFEVSAEPVIALIGAGNFTGQVLLPGIRKTGARLKTIAGSGGLNATLLGKKFGFQESTADLEVIIEDNEINTIFITTRHNSHADLVIRGLKAGKHVFVEKPLCLNEEELQKIETAYRQVRQNSSGPPTLLTVGFNRRFSPFMQKIKDLLDSMNENIDIVMTINAGIVPADHWVQDIEIGGGRIIGEVCHFIDLLRFLTGSPLCDISSTASVNGVFINLVYKNGSAGAIQYLANGHRSFPKERLEVFCGGRILALNNFKRLSAYGWPGFKGMRIIRQDKGHEAELAAFLKAIKEGGPEPIPFAELVETTRASFTVFEQAGRQLI